MKRLIDADRLASDEYLEKRYGSDFYWEFRKRVDKQPTVEAIPKADYENRLKADMVAMLEELDLQIDEFDSGCGWDGYIKKIDVHVLIQQKINALGGKANVSKEK